MRALHIINDLHTGGAQAVLVDLLTHWGNPRDELMVLTLAPGGSHTSRLRQAGIRVEDVGRHLGGLPIVNLPRLLRAIRLFSPDVVQTWLYHTSLVGSLAVRAVSRAPIVWGLHHTLAGRQSLKLMTWGVVRLLAALSHKLPASIICCSQSALDSHAAHGFSEAKLTVVENGVDADEFRPDASARAAVRQELGLDAQTRLIGMFARLHPQKDHATLVTAAGLLHHSMPNVHFVLAGEGVGPANESLRRRLESSGSRQVFHLLGDRSDMPRLSAAMDIVTLSSSDGEAMPRTLAEAMACGVPCVATAVGDSPALLGDTGLVVEPRQPQALAEAWQRILSLPKAEYEELSARARRRVQQHFDLPHMVSGYRAIHERLAVAG